MGRYAASPDVPNRRPRPGRMDKFFGERFSGLTPGAKSADSSGAMHAQPPRTGPPLVARGGSPETGGAHHDVAPDGAVVVLVRIQMLERVDLRILVNLAT